MARLVLLGGGHAHMTVMASLNEFLDRGHEVRVVGPEPYHYYSGMGPGMLGGHYTPEEIRFDIRRMVESKGASFVEDKAERIDAASRVVHLASGQHLEYDVLSCNTGSVVDQRLAAPDATNVYTVKPIANLLAAQKRIRDLASSKRELRIGVVGGGPAALEVAGNALSWAHRVNASSPKVTVFGGKEFLRRHPGKVRQFAIMSLEQRGIELVQGSYVDNVTGSRVVLEDGSSADVDLVFLAQGVRPSPLFRASDVAVGPNGGLAVNEYLQSTEEPSIFGGGDCIHFEPEPLDKVGVYAVRENPILKANLMAQLEGKELTPFDPGDGYLLIFNLGDGTGIFWRKKTIFHGRPAFWLKDFIDRRFMKRFQKA